MSGFLALLVLLAPGAPAGAGAEGADPLERRVAGLLAGAPAFSGIAAVVPLYERTPEEGAEAEPAWADGALSGRLLVEDGRTYLRVVNPRRDPVLLSAGIVFAGGAAEVAVARDALIPGDFAALVPAAPLRSAPPCADLAPVGALPPAAISALLAGPAEFDATVAAFRALRGEERYLPVLANEAVRARHARLAALVASMLRGRGGTVVGAVFLVRDRPVAAHLFASHELFAAALPDLLSAFAVEIRDRELAGQAGARRRPTSAVARQRALLWLREVARPGAAWSESCGFGSEMFFSDPTVPAIGHAVADGRQRLVHAGIHAWTPPVAPVVPPTPPEEPGEPVPGLIPHGRPTEEEQRRAELVPDQVPPAPLGLALGRALLEPAR